MLIMEAPWGPLYKVSMLRPVLQEANNFADYIDTAHPHKIRERMKTRKSSKDMFKYIIFLPTTLGYEPRPTIINPIVRT